MTRRRTQEKKDCTSALCFLPESIERARILNDGFLTRAMRQARGKCRSESQIISKNTKREYSHQIPQKACPTAKRLCGSFIPSQVNKDVERNTFMGSLRLVQSRIDTSTSLVQRHNHRYREYLPKSDLSRKHSVSKGEDRAFLQN